MPEQRPNVLLICTDHWPGLIAGPAGDQSVMTPTLDQLAQCGSWFSNAYSVCPSCIPARRTLMTSLTPQQKREAVAKLIEQFGLADCVTAPSSAEPHTT